jgi:GT2 family glycosyltransferase
LADAEFVTANCFCRRVALELVGGFDERFTMAWREDSDLQFSLLERGVAIVQVPEAVVVHPVRPGSWGISLRQQRKSVFNALLYKKHPRLYRQRIQPHPPRLYYAIVGAAAAAIAGGLLRIRLVAFGAGLWTALTAWFLARRLHGTSRDWCHVAEMALTSALIPPLSIFWRIAGGIKFRVAFF